MNAPARPTFLLLGNTGQVGWELERTLAPLGRVAAMDFPAIDFTAPASLGELIARTQPTVVLNAAAYTAVDRAEQEPERARAINADAPAALAAACREHGALLVHYSTDYIFEGAKGAPYVETDPPAPLNVYGRTKLAGDQAIAASGADHLIFRLCWVYGARGQNFLRTIRRLAGERETLRVVNDQRGSPTWCRLIAEATAQAVAQVLRAPDRQPFVGTYHLSAAGDTTWHGFASAIVDALPPAARRCREVTPIPTTDYPLPARRPPCSILDSGKLERVFGLRLPRWDEGLRLLLASEET